MIRPAENESSGAGTGGATPAEEPARSACVACDETPAPLPTELWSSLVPHPQWGKWNDPKNSVILSETQVIEL